MPDYTILQSKAARLIAKFGQSAILRQITTSGPPYDPIITETDYPCTLAVLRYDDAAIDGTRILATDKLVYVSAEGLTITPSETDKLVIGGVVHAIVNIETIAPAGAVVFWAMGARA